MSRRHLVGAVLGTVLWAGGCLLGCAGARQSHLPPPEYERPELPPFPENGAPEDAGSGGTAGPTGLGGAPPFTEPG